MVPGGYLTRLQLVHHLNLDCYYNALMYYPHNAQKLVHKYYIKSGTMLQLKEKLAAGVLLKVTCLQVGLHDIEMLFLKTEFMVVIPSYNF